VIKMIIRLEFTVKIHPPPRLSPARGEGNPRPRRVWSRSRIFISGGDKIFLSWAFDETIVSAQ